MAVGKLLFFAVAMAMAVDAQAAVKYDFTSANADLTYRSADFIDFGVPGRRQLPSSSFVRNNRYEAIQFSDFITVPIQGRDDRDTVSLISFAGASPIFDSWSFDDGVFKRFGTYTVTGTSYFGSSLPAATLTVSFVPEPTAWAMMVSGFGLAGLTFRRRTPAIAAA